MNPRIPTTQQSSPDATGGSNVLRSLKIGTRLFGLAAGLIGFMAVLAAAGLLTAGSVQGRLRSAVGMADTLSRKINIARSAQRAFKTQVQEWKDLLIRGHNPLGYDKHLAAFTQRERDVQADLASVRVLQRATGEDTTRVSTLLGQLQDLDVRYRIGIARYDRRDARASQIVDSLVRGLDRGPTAAFDTIVAKVIADAGVQLAQVNAQANASYDRMRLTFIIMLVVAGLIAAAAAGMIIRGIVVPVKSAVALAQAVAAGDLNASIVVDGADEVGQLQAALREMTRRLSETISQVRNGAEALSAASSQVAATSQALSQGTSEQAASVEETTA